MIGLSLHPILAFSLVATKSTAVRLWLDPRLTRSARAGLVANLGGKKIDTGVAVGVVDDVAWLDRDVRLINTRRTWGMRDE